MRIEQPGRSSPCEAWKNEGGAADVNFTPADLLPPVTGAASTGTETVIDVVTRHSTFGQAAVSFPGKGAVSGEMWQAVDGGYLVKYNLSAQGGPDLLGQAMEGTMTWEYQLIGVNSNIQTDLPGECPPGLISVPPMDGAQVITDQPALQEFTVEADLKGVESYYQEKLASMGYTLKEPPRPDVPVETLIFTRPGLELDILVEKVSDASSHVLISLQRDAGESSEAIDLPEPTPTPDPLVSIAQRLSQALSLLEVSNDKPSPLGSFHLEVNESVPGVDKASGKANLASVKITADVEGSNYYLHHLQDGKSVSEGYMIDGQESELKNGQVTPGMGFLDLDWVSWPLDIVMPYGIASMGPTPAGQETVDGRTADVFDLDSAKADPASLAMLQSMNPFTNLNVSAASGRVWLDQQTGVMLKLSLAYTTEVKDAQGISLGLQNGQVELLVTRVGAVSVKLP